MAKISFKIPVIWEVCSSVIIEAESIDEAVEIFNKTSDGIPLPKNSNYIDGSFKMDDYELIEIIGE